MILTTLGGCYHFDRPPADSASVTMVISAAILKVPRGHAMHPDDVLVILLAGGAGERLSPLTADRAKPAVYFGGPYRIIDFTLSNCINSGLRRIFIATQYKSLSLNRHIRMAWNVVSEELGEFVEILPPQKRVGEHWYLGTADAVYQNLYSIVREAARHVIVLSGDHVYKMDYSKMLRFHLEKDADVTLATIEVPIDDGRRFGIVGIDEDERVRQFVEKPAEPAVRAGLAAPGAGVDGHLHLQGRRARAHARARRRAARQPARLRQEPDPAADSHRPRVLATASTTRTRRRRSYWRDIGTLDAYYEASMDLCDVSPEFNLYDPEWPLRTCQPQAPPAKFVFGDEGRRCGYALDSVISNGCIISGSRVSGSVLCPNVRVHSFGTIERSILMPGVRVGRHARIRRAIIDRDVLIPRGAVIGFDAAEDRRRHAVTDGGVVVVTANDEPLHRSDRRRCAAGRSRSPIAGSSAARSNSERTRSMQISRDPGPRNSGLARQPHGGSGRLVGRRRWDGRRCRPARRPANAKRSNCATATRGATSGKGVTKAVAHINGEIATALVGQRRSTSDASTRR